MNYRAFIDEVMHKPLRVVRPKPWAPPLFVKVLVFDIATGQQIREHSVNFTKMMKDNDKKLKWLLNLVVWAGLNGKTVEFMSEKDHRKELQNV
jgi:hypothetical protein